MNEKQSALALGILIPLFLCAAALWAAHDGVVTIRGRGGAALVLRGFDVVLYVSCFFSMALALHAHQFWANLMTNVGYAEIIAYAGIGLFVAAIVWLAARQMLDFV